MATISSFLRLLNNVPTVINMTANSFSAHSIFVGADSSPTELTVGILNNLVNLQNGTDFSSATNSHTHNGIYYQQSVMNSTNVSTPGASVVGVSYQAYANISGYGTTLSNTLANYNVQALLDSINVTLGSLSGSLTSLGSTSSGSPGASTVGVAYQTYSNLPGYSTTIANTLANYNVQSLLNAFNTALAPPAIQVYSEPMTVIASGSPTNNQVVLPGSFPATITLPLDSRESFELRQYVVGSGTLQVWLNGQYLPVGQGYTEVGGSDTLSNQIQITDPLSVGDVLSFRIVYFITLVSNNIYEEPIQFITSGTPTNNQMIVPGSFPATIGLPLDSRNSFATRTYTVGAGRLQVWLNGEYLTLGNDWLELGSTGSSSGSISLVTPVVATDVLVLRIGY